eukprot:scaffold6337_cov112-Isochrysis_galbana.AAC.5
MRVTCRVVDPLLAVLDRRRCEGDAARSAWRTGNAERGSPGTCGRHTSHYASVSVIGLNLAARN